MSAPVKERPIIFSGAMVNAILENRKPTTRRVVNRLLSYGKIRDLSKREKAWSFRFGHDALGRLALGTINDLCPHGVPGDRLWVRETWADVNTMDGPAIMYRADGGMHFCLDDEDPVNYDRYPGCEFAAWHTDMWDRTPGDGNRWRSSIHMPRWASRITLEITDVRVERLQEITEAGAKAEGCKADNYCSPRGSYSLLWDKINAKRGYSWASNPWVWVVEFGRVTT